MSKKMTEEKIRDAIAGSISIAEVLKKMSMSVTTANYRAFHKAVQKYQLDVKHFLGRAHLKSQTRNIKTTIPLEKILVEKSTYLNVAQLKIRLVKSKLLTYQCYECKRKTWRGKPLSLQLDHINGIHNDHRIENLRLLCPNCHSQTKTFCGKNIKNSRSIHKRICLCGNSKHKDSKMCKKCAQKKQEKIIWPDNTILFQMVNDKGYSQSARELGISPTAIVKRLARSP